MESCARLSVSLEGPGLFAMTSSPLPTRNKHDFQPDDDDDDIDDNEYNDDDNEDDANDDNDGDDDEDENNSRYHNDHLPRDQDFANDLDISSHNDDENIENQSKNANFHVTSSSTSTSAGGKSRRTLKSRSSSNDPNLGGASVDCNFTDSQDDVDGDEMMRCVVKRRYKQNKKKSPSTSNTAQMRGVQQQRRLRTNTNSKSIDAAHTTTTPQQSDFLNDYELIGKTSVSSSTLKALADSSSTHNNAQQKSRVCSRCKRGIRHSSSCSSSTASGGAANGTNGSGMTMDELRAVNRYAESTKSLSYLPQVRDEYLLASRISV